MELAHAGHGVGVVPVLGWVLAALGGVDFGPSTVGVVAGEPNWWLIAFLLGIVAGGGIAARSADAFELRGETGVRYGQLLAGGFLLGAGGWIAGGCNLGHGLSGMAQLNVSSIVVVICMALGVGLARALIRPERRRRTRALTWRFASEPPESTANTWWFASEPPESTANTWRFASEPPRLQGLDSLRSERSLI